MLYALHVNACCLTRDAAAKNIQTNEQTNRQTNVTSATILPLGYAACKPRSKTSALRLLALPSFAMKREIEPGTFRKEMIANGNRPSFKAAFACTSVAMRSQGQSRSNKPARCNASETLSSFGKYCGKCFQQDAKCGFILYKMCNHQQCTYHTSGCLLKARVAASHELFQATFLLTDRLLQKALLEHGFANCCGSAAAVMDQTGALPPMAAVEKSSASQLPWQASGCDPTVNNLQQWVLKIQAHA